MIILDTNVLIEILKDNVSTLKAVAKMEELMTISSITAMSSSMGRVNTEVKQNSRLTQ